MALIAAPARSINRGIRNHWRGIAVISAILLVFGSIALTVFYNQVSLADRKYTAAAAEVDRLDPHWQLDDILAVREKLADSENSVLKVREIAGRLPGAWRGIKHYDGSFAFEGEAPEVRLSAERIEQLQRIFEVAEDVIRDARQLADQPRGQLDGVRPKAERLEQVGGLNAYVDANFPYGGDVSRVVFLLWLDAKLRIEAGDLETAIVDLRAMVNTGRSIGDYPGVSAQMSRSAGCWRAIPCLETALAQGQAASTSLAALQTLLEDEAGQPSRMIAIRGERAIIDDLFEQIHNGKLSASAITWFSDYSFWDKAFSTGPDIRENQANLLRFHTRQVEAGRLPETEQMGAMQKWNLEWSARAMKWDFLERERRLTETIALGRAGGMPTWLGMRDALVRTAIAALTAERFRIDQGRWPASLEDLVPKYISAVPRDPFVRGPLTLMKLPDGLFIYSVGYDGKDDGGKIDPKMRMRDGADTGFRLWDVKRRRQAAGTGASGKSGLIRSGQ